MVRTGLLLLLVLVVLQFPLEVNADISDTAGFSDVPADYWAASAIADLANRSIIGGYPDGSFQPESPGHPGRIRQDDPVGDGVSVPTGGLGYVPGHHAG